MRLAALLPSLLLSACAMNGAPGTPSPPFDDGVDGAVRETRHAGVDDLLSGGLGLDGLRAATPPALSDSAATPAELRRLAIWANWRGIVDLSEAGGFGRVWGPAADHSLPLVPGREYSAFARVPGAGQPHRVLVQVPDAFDRSRRCLVVAPTSGSRGIYGAIGFAGAFALPRGCAVAYTDKGAGSDAFDWDSNTGASLDGTRTQRGTAMLGFAPEGSSPGMHRISIKHAHSGDNPEADWPRQVMQAAAFGLRALSMAFPAEAPFTPENTRIVLAGLSNGAGAVLRAAELPEAARVAAVVAAAPQLHLAGGSPLYDYATLAGLLQPCALLDPRLADAPWPAPRAAFEPALRVRCESLARAGLVSGSTIDAQAADAYRRLEAAGFDAFAQRAGALNVAFDLWRSVGAIYASAYARARADEAVCGYGFAALDAGGRPRATTPTERTRWFGEHTGVAPSAGIALLDTLASGGDPALPGLLCARSAWTGDDPLATRVRAGVSATQASGRPFAPRVIVVHGRDDGLIPAALTIRPWVEAARAQGADVRAIEVANVQHFDAFLGLPTIGPHYLPLLPYAWAALDAALAAIDDRAALPVGGAIETTPRGIDAKGQPLPLDTPHLGDLGSVYSEHAGKRVPR
jgi:hydroxybutyrate-dimer hydrolase